MAPTGSTALVLEIEALRAEVAHLKRLLAERPPLKVPKTAAERKRNQRAKAKA
jgi:hypothetical protein